MMSSRTLFAFGLVALAALLCVSAHPAASDAVAEAKDDSQTQYFNTNNSEDVSEEIADVDDLSVSNAPTDSCGAINDVFLFTFDKSALWCAYNDTLIVRMENNPTNRAIAPCQWRSTSCGSYTMIFQNVGSGNKFLTCASNPAKTFCRKISIMNPFADRGQFFVRSTVVGLDTFSSNRFDNKFLADSAGLITLGTSATAFKLCKKSDVATC